MAGTFIQGETKVRPNSYFNIQKKGGSDAAGSVSGVVAVIFKADFGPLNTAVELSAEDGYESVFGNAGTTDALREAFAGGTKTIVACRVGNGGTSASVTLNDNSEGTEAVTITAKYPGKKAFAATIRKKLSDPTLKECVIYAGTAEFEKFEFAAGTGEANALAAAMASSKSFNATALAGDAELKEVSQTAFSVGTDPTTTNNDYSNAFAEVEPYEFNTICVDTEETSVHTLLQSFVNRIFDAASLAIAVVAEKHDTDLEEREAHAAAFNDEKVVYVLNAYASEQGTEIDGYLMAARIAGLISATTSSSSLTHTVISGITEIKERLSNTEIINAEKKGCLVLSYNAEKQVWIDSAINTFITPAANQDDGWKKIRRVKTRFELIRRVTTTTDNLIGKVDNDVIGRGTVISQIQGIGDAMIEEGKLVACRVSESAANKADGDSAWFDIDVVDKDSMEHIYLTFYFRFSTNDE